MYTLQDWRDNPLWKPIRALSNMETLPGECAPFRVYGQALIQQTYLQTRTLTLGGNGGSTSSFPPRSWISYPHPSASLTFFGHFLLDH